jgi:glycerophosphoryl diester phosphodiesterase
VSLPAPGSGPPEIIGHRGYPDRFPENTLPSLEGALEAGCRSLEWDVKVTADGVPVLFHDETLERTTDGEGPLAERTLGELRELDAGAWFHPRFRGTRIPTLREALEAVAGRVERIYPEVKAARSPGQSAAAPRRPTRRGPCCGSCRVRSG